MTDGQYSNLRFNWPFFRRCLGDAATLSVPVSFTIALVRARISYRITGTQALRFVTWLPGLCGLTLIAAALRAMMLRKEFNDSVFAASSKRELQIECTGALLGTLMTPASFTRKFCGGAVFGFWCAHMVLALVRRFREE